MLNQRTDESDVIDVVDRGVRTARSGIPGKQPLVEASRAVRIDDHKRFAIRECVHERVFFFVFSVSAAAVKVKNDWNIAHLIARAGTCTIAPRSRPPKLKLMLWSPDENACAAWAVLTEMSQNKSTA